MTILIAEDEIILGLDLVQAVWARGGRPVGPAQTVAHATRLLRAEPVAAAILDAQLVDGAVTPIALALIERSVPFVIHTGVGVPAELAALHPDLPVIRKPAAADIVIDALVRAMEATRG